ncbi:retrovirus-related pol polyprotein from transposon TNT 1-94 [Tanacetum coccineum]
MHNNIMAAGSRDRPPMLATGRYAQWRSRFLRYIDTRPNGDALRKCILEGPYNPSTVIIPAVPATDNSPTVPEQTTVETVLNIIGDEIYSTVDACKTAHEIWEAIERLQQEWSRFITIVKQQHKLDEVLYHKLFDILKQYQKEVNELRAERIAKNANLLALVATAQPYQDPYYQTSKSHKSYALTSKASLPTRSYATTRHKGKEIAKPITPPSESASEEDSDPEQAQKDKEMQKNLALIGKYFKKIYKPTNNNLRTSSNTRNKNVDTTPRYKNDNQTGQFGNQRTMTVAGARETIGGQVVQQSVIQCFNCKEFGHFAKECRKPKRVKDSTYHKEKMLLYTDEEIDEQELEAHYSYLAKIQEVPTADTDEIQHSEQPESISNTCAMETGDSNVIPDSPNMCDNDIQNDQNAIKKQLKKANASLTQELTECKSILAKTSRTLGESNSIRDSCLVALQNKQTEFERYKNLNDRIVDFAKLENKLNETLGLLAQKHIDIKEGLKLKAYTILVVKEKHDELVKQSLLTKSHYEGLVKEKIKVITDLKLKEEKDIGKMISMEKQLKEIIDQAWVKHSNDHLHLRAPTAHDMEILIKTCLMPLALKTHNDSFAFVHELKQEMHADLKYVESLEKEVDELESDKAKFSNMYDMLLQEYVSNDVMCSYLHSLSDLDEHTELQCLYLHKVKECNCLAQKLSKQTESVTSNVFQNEHEQYLEIQALKAQLQDKNIAICKLKKLIEKCKGKSVETKFDKPSVVRQPNAQRITKPSVLGKLAPFSDSLERKHFSKTKSVPKTNVLEILSKPVTTQNLPQTARRVVSNTNVIKPCMYRINTRKTQTKAPQLPQTSRNTNPRVSTSTGVIHKTTISRPQLRSTQIKDKVVPNNSHMKDKKTKVEDHPRISSISNKTKSVTACNDSLKSKTSNVNVV